MRATNGFFEVEVDTKYLEGVPSLLEDGRMICSLFDKEEDRTCKIGCPFHTSA